MAVKIQLRHDTTANWTSEDPVLAQGEVGLDLDENKMKMGDGVTAWTGLSFLAGGDGDVAGPASVTDGNIALFDGTTGKLLKQHSAGVSGFLSAANNLSDIADAATARTNLGVSTGAAPISFEEFDREPSAIVGDGVIFTRTYRTGGSANYGNVTFEYKITAATSAPDFDVGFTAWTSHNNMTGGNVFGGWIGANSPTFATDTYSGGAVVGMEINFGNKWADFGLLADVGVTRYTVGLQIAPDAVPEHNDALPTTYPGSFGLVFGEGSQGNKMWTGTFLRAGTLMGGGRAFSINGSATAANQPLDAFATGGYWVNGIDLSAGSYTGFSFKAPNFIVANSNGLTGIGVVAPVGQRLHVLGGAGVADLSADTNSVVTFGSSSSVQLAFGATSAGAYPFWIQTKQSVNLGNAFQLHINPLGGDVGIGVGAAGTADRRFHVETDDATTNAVTYAQRLTHTTSGTPANGIGVGLEFEVETAAGNNEVGMAIEAVAADVTATAEDFDMVVRLMTAGAAMAEKLRLRSTGEPVFHLPSSAAALGANGEVTMELTSNTAFTVKARGSDGTTRSGTLTLA